MPQAIGIPSLDLVLIAGRAIALVLSLLTLAWALRRWQRTSTRDTQRLFEQLDLLRAELLQMKEVMQAHRITHDTKPSPAAPSIAVARGYEIAARLARQGAQKDDLMKSCGITGHEADLLVKLHGQKHTASIEMNAKRFSKLPVGQGVTAQEIAHQPATLSKAATPLTAQATPRRNAITSSPPIGAQSAGSNSADKRDPVKPTAAVSPKRSRLVAVG